MDITNISSDTFVLIGGRTLSPSYTLHVDNAEYGDDRLRHEINALYNDGKITVSNAPARFPVEQFDIQPFKSEIGTTSIDTFSIEESFNVNAAGLVLLAMTLISVSPDGETFGSGVGEIGVLFQPQDSTDGITWQNSTAISTSSILDNSGHAININDFYSAIYATHQQGRGVATIVNSDGTPYAGSNHPTATVRFDYSVLTIGSNLQ
jgi:hypothetical protein